MTEPRHPLHGVGILVWHCPEAPAQRKWLALFSEYKSLPIYFPAASREAAYQAALKFQNDAIEKHEYEWVTKQARAEKARKARERKAAV